jgi:hypothetical protein
MRAMSTLHDGFVRLTLDDVLSVPFRHLVSGLDSAHATSCGTSTTISGYTEWVSATHPTITVGWDWVIAAEGGGAWRRVGLPRSNLMLVDPARRDYAWDRNLAVLATVVDAIPWQDEARCAISQRYAH